MVAGLGFSGVLIAASAPGSSPGTIEGRIFNPGTGEYVELVRVTVEGTRLETFTDSAGLYRLTHVPPGVVTLNVFRTGLVEQTQAVSVGAGQTVQQDFTVTALHRTPPGEGVVKLDEFVVASSREMDAAAIAINTQRFAPNLMNVVAADEFGDAAETKVGEILKLVPGLSMTFGGGGEPFQVSMDGVPSENVPITVGGFNLASSGAGTTRAIGLHQIAINTISRIEILHTPTPESSGSALAGSVNLVPRNAFERARPIYTLSASLSMRDSERSLKRTPGPWRRATNKIRPGGEFTAIVPVNKRFGFTISASNSSIYRVQPFTQNTWRGTGVATNGAAFPDTTPDQPYMTQYSVRDGGNLVMAASFGATVDFQVSRNDTLSFSFQWAYSDFAQTTRMLGFFINRVAPGNFTTTSTHGAPGAGEIRITNNSNNFHGNLYMPTLTYRHNGPVWRAEAAAGHSRSLRGRRDATNGHFFSTQARRQNVTVSFDDIFYLRPRRITVADGATGAPIDPYRIDNYTLNTASTNFLRVIDLQQTAYANLRRSFGGPVPLTLKGGLDFRRQKRDVRNPNPTLTFVGPDGRPNTADDNASQVFDEQFSQRIAPYGFPRIDWTSNAALWDIYEINPEYFTENSATSYTQQVSTSRHAEELISAAFLRGDTQFLQGRLRFVGGVRAEQTNVEVEGRLIDPTLNFQRNASGQVIRGANGQPLPIATNPLEVAQLTNIDRGLRAKKEYLRWFPSLNASYNVTGNFIARAGHYRSLGRPNFNQYGGSVTLPNTENPPAPNNRISVGNAGIKAWSARTTKVALEYYFEPAGLVSVSAFQRDFKNLFGSTVFPATPAFLNLYGINPAIYEDYEVNTQHNIATPVRATGVSFNYKQALTFLPHWARGIRVFANVSAQRVTGDESESFTGYTPRVANWGISLSRQKFTARMNWNYNGKRRLGPVAEGRSIEPGTFNWSSKRLILDFSGQYFLTRRISLFANLNNLLDAPVDAKIYGPSTPAHANFRQRQNFDALWTFGVKGTF
jgi:iron complex outermembrane recepter protein